MKMVNVAVIGTGNMGRNHARVYFELEDAALVAISDINEEEGKVVAEEFGCNLYSDYKEMIEREDIDAISIAVPTRLHKKVALDCINKGVHILIEKPIADTIEGAEEIIEAAEKMGVVLTVGHIERFNPAVFRLKEIIKQGKLGEITSIIARRVGIFPSQIRDANVFLDLAVHDIDIFNYLLESTPDSVYSAAGKIIGSREDHAIILLSYNRNNGNSSNKIITCFVQVNWITPVKIRNLAVTGTRGYAELDYISQDLILYESIYEKDYDSFGDFVIKFGTPRKSIEKIKKAEPLKIELSHFIDCVKGKKTPLVTGSDALSALKISIDAMRSYKNHII